MWTPLLSVLIVLSYAGQVAAQTTSVDSALARGIVLLEDGDLQGAIDTLTLAARGFSTDDVPSNVQARVYLYLGVAYGLLDEDKASRASFREAVARDDKLTLDPDRFARKVVRVFEKVREEVASADPQGDKSASAQPEASEPDALLETAWNAVKTLAETASVPAEDRVLALRKFIEESPGDNPHRHEAEALIARLARSAPPARELYAQAYTDYKQGRFDAAIQGFEAYVRHYPATDFSDNARYWIGECYYGSQRYTEAIESWDRLARDAPSSDRLPDARVKKGLALEKLGRRNEALVEYRYVVERYPDSPAAQFARQRLR